MAALVIWLRDVDKHETYVLDRQEPAEPRIRSLIVRKADPDQDYDAIWIDGHEPALDTEVIIDDVPAYATPRGDAEGVRKCFESHESRPGGRALL